MARTASETKETTVAAVAGRTREGDIKEVMQRGNQEVSGDLEPPRAEQKEDAGHSLSTSLVRKAHRGQEWLSAPTA